MHPRPLHDRNYAIVVRLVREIRLEVGLTQVELANRLGVDQSLVSKVERKERRLDIVELRSVCMVLGTSLKAFVNRLDEEIMAQALESDCGPRTD